MRGRARRDPPASYADAHYPQLHFGWSLLRSLRVGEWKYVDAPKLELYDLRTDPRERRSVLAERGNVAARMGGEIEAAWRSFGSSAVTSPPQPDPETLARLRSLGYVGIAAPSSGASRGPDPKDKIAELNVFRTLLSGAVADLKARRSDAAIDKLKRAVAINERAYDVHVMLGDAWLQKRRFETALGEYDAAAVLNPDIAAPHILAAEVYVEQTKLDEALRRLDAAAKLEPGSGEVAFARGRVYERAGRGREALAEFERAVTVNPSDAPARARLAGVAMNLREFGTAEPHLRMLLDTDYQPARTHYALGFIAESRGDRATAAAEYRRALARDPKLAQAIEALARVKNR
jgi:tetratricopeptide (TPR) repeat protein